MDSAGLSSSAAEERPLALILKILDVKYNFPNIHLDWCLDWADGATRRSTGEVLFDIRIISCCEGPCRSVEDAMWNMNHNNGVSSYFESPPLKVL